MGYKIFHQLGDIAESYGKFISMETYLPFLFKRRRNETHNGRSESPCGPINFDTANIYYYNKLKIWARYLSNEPSFTLYRLFSS